MCKRIGKSSSIDQIQIYIDKKDRKKSKNTGHIQEQRLTMLIQRYKEIME